MRPFVFLAADMVHIPHDIQSRFRESLVRSHEKKPHPTAVEKIDYQEFVRIPTALAPRMASHGWARIGRIAGAALRSQVAAPAPILRVSGLT